MRDLFLLFFLSTLIYTQTSKEFIDSGIATSRQKDDQSAIQDFTKTMGGDPNRTCTYYNHSIGKNSLEDHRGALEDFIKTIGYDPNHTGAYCNSGVAKHLLSDKNRACLYCGKAGELEEGKKVEVTGVIQEY